MSRSSDSSVSKVFALQTQEPEPTRKIKAWWQILIVPTVGKLRLPRVGRAASLACLENSRPIRDSATRWAVPEK